MNLNSLFESDFSNKKQLNEVDPRNFDSDEDLNKLSASKIMHDEIVDVCQSIMKELNSRTFQLRDYIAWERFIQGIG